MHLCVSEIVQHNVVLTSAGFAFVLFFLASRG